MSNPESNPDKDRTNDMLQGGEGNDAFGEDARDFGVGGQREQRAFDEGDDDAPDRETGRDPTTQGLDQPARERAQ
jgi:hypothetical protein